MSIIPDEELGVMALEERFARALFLAEHPNSVWSAGRARAIWFTLATAVVMEIAAIEAESLQ